MSQIIILLPQFSKTVIKLEKIVNCLKIIIKFPCIQMGVNKNILILLGNRYSSIPGKLLSNLIPNMAYLS